MYWTVDGLQLEVEWMAVEQRTVGGWTTERWRMCDTGIPATPVSYPSYPLSTGISRIIDDGQ